MILKCQLQAIQMYSVGKFFNIAMKRWCKRLHVRLEASIGDFPKTNTISEI